MVTISNGWLWSSHREPAEFLLSPSILHRFLGQMLQDAARNSRFTARDLCRWFQRSEISAREQNHSASRMNVRAWLDRAFGVAWHVAWQLQPAMLCWHVLAVRPDLCSTRYTCSIMQLGELSTCAFLELSRNAWKSHPGLPQRHVSLDPRFTWSSRHCWRGSTTTFWWFHSALTIAIHCLSNLINNLGLTLIPGYHQTTKLLGISPVNQLCVLLAVSPFFLLGHRWY